MDWAKFWQSIFLPLVAGIGLLALGIWLYFYSSLQQGDTLSAAMRQILGTLATGLSGIALLYKTAKTAQSSTTSPFNLKLSTYLRVPNYQERAGFLTQFRDDLDIVMESVTQGGRRSLIIFIDDLDRCAPAKTVEIVEAMNFLLDAKYCIFVLGLDTRMVAASIEAKYDTMQKFIDDISEVDGIPFGQQFLEKIAQLTFRIPRSDKTLISSFVTALGQRGSISVPQERSANITEISSSIPDTLVSVDGENQKLTMVSSYQSQEQFAVQMNDSSPVQKAIEHVAPYLEPNPRKIKRFINIFRLQAFIANRRNLLVLDEADYYLDLLARWVALITQWPIVLDRTLADIAFLAHLKEAYNLYSDLQDLRFNSDNEPVKHDVLIKKLEPYFEDEHIKQLVEMVGFSIMSTFTDEDIQKLPTLLSSTQAVVPSVQERIVSPQERGL